MIYVYKHVSSPSEFCGYLFHIQVFFIKYIASSLPESSALCSRSPCWLNPTTDLELERENEDISII